jgi:hypothetical protein
MAQLHIITIMFLTVCLFSIGFTIFHLCLSKKKSKKMFDIIYQEMKFLKSEIDEIKKIL